MVKKILLGLILVVLGLQFIRPEKNLAPTPGKNDLFVQHPAPAEVKRLVEIACYDCHSDNTRYPLYAEIQPLGWWIAAHTRDGKRELNLSAFGELSAKRKGSRIEAMVDALQSHSMPLKSYTLIHRDAIFTEAQTKQIVEWLEALRDKVAPE
jgi:hypothetical protein